MDVLFEAMVFTLLLVGVLGGLLTVVGYFNDDHCGN
jgi:hypothetical protein